jgi:hypothetical protein
VDDLRQRHAEFVLVARELDAVLDVRHFFPEGIDSGEPACRAFHERSKLGTEQVDARIGNAAEFVRLERGTSDDE